jgi:hypothetical protein
MRAPLHVTRLLVAVIATVALLAAAASASAAVECSTCTPWWHLTSGSRPANLQPGSVKNTVEELKVQATSGEFTVFEPNALGEGKRQAASFSFDASAKTVEEGLQGIFGLTARAVEVSGKPGGPYTITFPGQFLPALGVEGKASIRVLSEGRSQQVIASAANLGDAVAEGESSPIELSDQLPAGVRAVSIEAIAQSGANAASAECSLVPLQCTFSHRVYPYDQLEARIGVVPEQGFAAGGQNAVSVSGGGAPEASVQRRLGRPAGFGVEEYELSAEEAGGAPDRQAGSHPFQLTNTLVLDAATIPNRPRSEYLPAPVAPTKDLAFKLPPGLIGNPTPFQRCTMTQFTTLLPGDANACPPQTVVGVTSLIYVEPDGLGLRRQVLPLFNVEPAEGEPARFGFFIGVCDVPVFIDTALRGGSDYGVTASVDNITQCAAFMSSQVTFWGVPGAPAHDNMRGWQCVEATANENPRSSCSPLGAIKPPPLLVMPAACPLNPGTGYPEPLPTSVETDSWLEPRPLGQSPSFAGQPMPGMEGCNRLPFDPSIKVTPDGTAASSATGLNVDVHVDQSSVLNGRALAEAEPRGITVALPEGVAVNPAGGDGLGACSEGLVGFQGFEALETLPGLSTAVFTPRLPGSTTALLAGETAPLEPGVNFCPNASKIGTAKIKTPLLPNALEGAVYLATQNENPFGSLIAMYIVVEDPVSGVVVKLTGQVNLTATGQLVTTFANTPQAPFEDAELHFFGGERAPLASPARCGAYTTTASFVPWSAEPGEAPYTASGTFDITAGPNGSACPGANLPFSPSLTGGSTNINAGSFSPFTTTIGREDGNQNMQSVTLHMPPGLSGLLSGVKLCGESQANEGTCGPESLIGETTVSAGVGSDPVSVKGGRVYITEKYAGAPFGLSIVDPVKAGPFDLEHDTANPNQDPPCDCIVVRARVEVDPHTAALTITTDPSGPHAIPHLIDGIPVQIKKVNVLINRPGFTFNPTNCDPMGITGTIGSDEGASSPVEVPFQATNCAALKFVPEFAVSTSAKTSRASGASLHVKLSYPNKAEGAFDGPEGAYTNIARVKVELPKVLPSRLTTLQKACSNAQFEANPAGCPPASIVGHAKAITPLIPVPLEGPAYFVSHGGEAFPSLIVVLQGYGVTVDLVGTTFIDKAGITSSTFKTVPDAPVGSFELTLPQGKYSALAANGNLCKTKLAMPTEFVAQNGAEITDTTKISVTGCPKAKKAKHAKKSSKHKRKAQSHSKKKKH